MNIINLKLNSAGILAFKSDKKVLYTEVEECCINECLINTLFPLCLVESWTVEKSWLGRKGEKVAVITPEGNRYLGEIDYEEYNIARVKYYVPEDNYNHFVSVHANGIEVTHCKKKIRIEEISAEEVERFEKMLKNVPFTNVLKMLNEANEAIKYDPAELELPEWLNIETLNRVSNLLKERKNEFYYGVNEGDNDSENF